MTGNGPRTRSFSRIYDERAVARLGFIGRAKRLGLPLEDIRRLVGVWHDGPCAAVKTRLDRLIEQRAREVVTRIDELTAFAAELRRARLALTGPTPAGRCDDTCGCTHPAGPPIDFGLPSAPPGGAELAALPPGSGSAEPPAACPGSSGQAAAVPDSGSAEPPASPGSVEPPAASPGSGEPSRTADAADLDCGNPAGPVPAGADPALACALSGADQADRLGAWAALLERASGRRARADGIALYFPADAGLAGRLVELAVHEQECCPFFSFTLELSPAGTTLGVRAPAEAGDLVTAVFGTAS